jgi:transposase
LNAYIQKNEITSLINETVSNINTLEFNSVNLIDNINKLSSEISLILAELKYFNTLPKFHVKPLFVMKVETYNNGLKYFINSLRVDVEFVFQL